MLESIALESFNLSFPPEDFCSIRGVLSAQAGIYCFISLMYHPGAITS